MGRRGTRARVEHKRLNGLAWDLEVAAVWEAWVRGFAGCWRLNSAFQRRLVESRRPFGGKEAWRRWAALAPDVGLIGDQRVVWIDAKYKAHLSLLARHGWRGTTEPVREAHSADLHQALAYASLVDVDRVDTVLLAPRRRQHTLTHFSGNGRKRPAARAAGSRSAAIRVQHPVEYRTRRSRLARDSRCLRTSSKRDPRRSVRDVAQR